MLRSDILKTRLAALDGKDYGAYQSLLGEYDFELYHLILHQIPKDPYAPPHTGIYRIRVRRSDPGIINRDTSTKIKAIAFRDFLARRFYQASRETAPKRRGTGYSGIITINAPGQAILERSSVVLEEDTIELRCFVGMPAAGRNIKAQLAEKMLCEELPYIIRQTLLAAEIDGEVLNRHIATAEDAEYLRDQLVKHNLIAFVANDSILPRASGSSDLPLEAAATVRFQSPPSLTKEIKLPHHGPVQGMALPRGVTLIVGGGYHGKSTLLQAIESGIYNHIPGDGRELCVSVAPTVKVRAYSGRYIEKTDISPFIRNLPFQKDTSAFSTDNASGSTSQAAGIMEAVEIGAEVLLMDEDTCATNFMIRDQKMQQLVRKEDEPITTFIDRVRQLYQERNISTVLVLGGAGDYFTVSDLVIQMNNYRPFDVTKQAHDIAESAVSKRVSEDGDFAFVTTERMPLADSIDPCNEYGKKGIYATDTHRLNFGKNQIDLTDLEQLIELSQTKAIGFALDYARRYMDQDLTIRQVVEQVMADIEQYDIDVLSERITGNLAWFRSFELAFTLNRLRGFKVRQKRD